MKATSTFGSGQPIKLLLFTRAIPLLWIVCNRIHIYVFWLPGIHPFNSSSHISLSNFIFFWTKTVESIMRSASGVQNRMNTILRIVCPITIKSQLSISNECKLIHSNLIHRVLSVGQAEFLNGRGKHDIKNDLQLKWNQFHVNRCWWREEKLTKIWWNTTICYFLFLQIISFLLFSAHYTYIQVYMIEKVIALTFKNKILFIFHSQNQIKLAKWILILPLFHSCVGWGVSMCVTHKLLFNIRYAGTPASIGSFYNHANGGGVTMFQKCFRFLLLPLSDLIPSIRTNIHLKLENAKNSSVKHLFKKKYSKYQK